MRLVAVRDDRLTSTAPHHWKRRPGGETMNAQAFADREALERESAEADAANFGLSTETAKLLEDCRAWIQRYVVVGEAEAVILAAWVLHTWAFSAAHTTPYLHVTSAELGSGKSTLLAVLRAVVREPLLSDNLSPAALARCVEQKRPTLLIDELDAALHGDKERAESLRGILNGGFEASGTYTRCVGRNFEIKSFSTFCPKVLSGIGEQWPTMASRSIRIEMRRKLRSEHVQPFRTRHVNAVSGELRERLCEWGAEAVGVLEDFQLDNLPGMTDRQCDISEPLAAIADLAGGEWPKRIVDSLEVLFARNRTGHAETIGVTLLRDIRTAFDDLKLERVPSARLAGCLCGMEGQPWADRDYGRGMNVNTLARQLKKYNISPRTIRTTEGTPKGYLRSDFEDVWERLCPLPPSETATPPQPASLLAESAFSKRNTHPSVAVAKSASNPHEQGTVAAVAVASGEKAETDTFEDQQGSPKDGPQAGAGTILPKVEGAAQSRLFL